MGSRISTFRFWKASTRLPQGLCTASMITGAMRTYRNPKKLRKLQALNSQLEASILLCPEHLHLQIPYRTLKGGLSSRSRCPRCFRDLSNPDKELEPLSRTARTTEITSPPPNPEPRIPKKRPTATENASDHEIVFRRPVQDAEIVVILSETLNCGCFRVLGFGLEVWGLGLVFRISDSGFAVEGLLFQAKPSPTKSPTPTTRSF